MTDNKRVGKRLEELVAENNDYEHVPDQRGAYYDARTQSGVPVEIKGCLREKKNGHSNGTPKTCPGHWIIQRDNHR